MFSRAGNYSHGIFLDEIYIKWSEFDAHARFMMKVYRYLSEFYKKFVIYIKYIYDIYKYIYIC